jgi:hypothetical protein
VNGYGVAIPVWSERNTIWVIGRLVSVAYIFIILSMELVPMSLQQQLHEFAKQACVGDAHAMDRFARLSMVLVKLVAREQLHGNRLARWMDDSDIAQVVVFRACRRVTNAKQHAEVANWSAMLRKMTKNAIADQARIARRDLMCRQAPPVSATRSRNSIEMLEDRSVSRRFDDERQNLLASIESQITPRLLPIWQMRRNGCTWTEIGRQVGTNPQALRVRFNAMLRTVAMSYHLSD